jgi:phage shock protein A
MGIFTRLKDIIGSNINAMLEKAEDPEKLIKLMIQEMEDTLVEIKASCAGAMATRKRIESDLEAAEGRVALWMERAELAVSRDRDDLGREALLEKSRYQERVEALGQELSQANELVEQYHQEIALLEEKLAAAREKHRILVRRHAHATRRQKAERSMRRLETSDAWVRFEQFENRIERMEADADLVNRHRKGTLEDQFASLDGDEDVDRELEELRRRVKGEPAAEANE